MTYDWKGTWTKRKTKARSNIALDITMDIRKKNVFTTEMVKHQHRLSRGDGCPIPGDTECQAGQGSELPMEL